MRVSVLAVLHIAWTPAVIRHGDVSVAVTAGRDPRRSQRLRSAIALALAGRPAAEKIHVLLEDSTPWALTNRPVDDLRRGPGLLTERVSQVRLGEVVRLLESGPDWSRITVEHDSYSGWIHSRALYICSEAEARAWQASCNVLVSAALAEASDEQGDLLQKVPFATRLPMLKALGLAG